MEKIFKHVDQVLELAEATQNNNTFNLFLIYQSYLEVKYLNVKVEDLNKNQLKLYQYNFTKDESHSPEYILMSRLEKLLDEELDDLIYYNAIIAICEFAISNEDDLVEIKYGRFLLNNIDFDPLKYPTKEKLERNYSLKLPYSELFLAELYLMPHFNDISKAIELCNESLKRETSPEAYTLLGCAYIDENRKLELEELELAYKYLIKGFKGRNKSFNKDFHFYSSITSLLNCLGLLYDYYNDQDSTEEIEKSVKISLEFTKYHHKLEYRVFDDLYHNRLAIMERYYVYIMEIKLGSTAVVEPFYRAIDSFVREKVDNNITEDSEEMMYS